MFWLNTFRPLSFLALSAALLVASGVQVSGQTTVSISNPAQVSSPNPGESSILPASNNQNNQAPAVVAIPTQPATPEELGDSLQARQRYQAAIAAYAKDPHPSAAVWNKMGIAYQMMFNLKDASRCYKESLKINPRNPLVINNLATVYDAGKQWGSAEKMYRKALKIDPRSAVILKNLGTNLLTQHKYAKGWQVYQQALAIDPAIFQDHSSPKVQNPSSLAERGALNYYMALGCIRTGQPDCAIDYLRMALNEGFIDAKKAAQDEQFVSLHDNPAFKQLLADQKQQKPQQP